MPTVPVSRYQFVLALLLALVVALGAWPGTWAHLRAASLLTRVAGGTGTLARLYDTPVVAENVLLRSPYGPFRARIYRPRDGAPRRGVLLTHGVHYMGIDEPRLIPFAQHLARSGLVVMTPELAALADYRVHPSSVAEIREAARYLARQPYVQPGGVSVLGLSFAGGLALLAASDPGMHDAIARVAALGGHHDLYRVSRFLATDELETPTGVRRMRAHDYGLVVFVYAHAEHFVAPDQVPLFRDALRHILHVDRDAAARAAAHLSPAARAVFDRINRNDKPALAPAVLRTLPGARAEMAALSPAGHAEGLRGVEVFLLHGAGDDVMPPTEAEDNARELARTTDVHLLVSPAIKHVTVEGRPTLWEQLRIVHAIAGVVQ
jgi:dienelactone hydrolase